MFLAQYEVLRERGHSPSEAFNETVEEATQSLYPLIGANGMDWMYEACSTTARRGAIDWSPKFKDALKPVFNSLYDAVKDGSETKRSLEYNSQKDYRQKFEAEMEEIRNLEIWRAGRAVRYVLITLDSKNNDDHWLTSIFSTALCVPRTRSKRFGVFALGEDKIFTRNGHFLTTVPGTGDFCTLYDRILGDLGLVQKFAS